MFHVILPTLISTLQSRRDLAAENLALRHQLNVLQRNAKKPQLRRGDRLLWVLLFRFWNGWRESLAIVRPETVIRWRREGFRLYWRWKSRPGCVGRPRVPREVRDLIGQMSEANPLWGAPRIHGELLKLGIEISQTAVSKYMTRRRKPSSQSWRPFLENHAKDIVSIDFFTVPTASFRVLFVLLMLSCAWRRVVHFMSEKQLRRLLRSYFAYYHGSRTHLGLAKDCPVPREVEPPDLGPVSERSMVGGLHHRYFRQAA